MPQENYRQVTGPEGVVNFPASMSDEDIGAAMRKNYPPKSNSSSLPEATISAYKPSAWDQIKEAVPVIKHVAAKLSGNEPLMTSMKPEDSGQLAYPERVYTPEQQAQHPIRTAFDEVAGSMTSPENLLMLKGFQGITGPLSRIISGGFAGQALHGVAQAVPEAKAAYDRGDLGEAKRLAAHAVLGVAVVGLAGTHAIRGESPIATETPKPVPKPEVKTAPDLGPGFRLVRDTFSRDPDFAKNNPDLNAELHHNFAASATPEEWTQFALKVQAKRDSIPLIGDKLEASKVSTPSREVAERQGITKASQAPSSQESQPTTPPPTKAGEPVLPTKGLVSRLVSEEEGSAANPFPRIAGVLDKVTPKVGKLLGDIDDVSKEEAKARMATREYAADLAKRHLQIESKFKEMDQSHETDHKTEIKAFMDAGEGKPGAQFLKPEDQVVASEFHQMFEERWPKIQKITESDKEGIGNYLSHLWKRPGQAKDIISSMDFGKSPIEGRAGFLKQRTYQYFSDGLDKGLEPITYNPIRMQMTALYQIDRFIAAHELKDIYKDAGLVNWMKVSDAKPQGWLPLNDKIFQPKVFDKDAGGLIEYGKYYAPPDVARIFNRYITPGLSGNVTYDAVRNYGNMLNQMNLGISGYHGVFITLVSSMSDVATGLKQLSEGSLKGVKGIGRGTLGTFLLQSARRDYNLGKSIQSEAINPSGSPSLQSYVDDLTKAGARFDQDPFYKQRNVKGFYNTLKTGNPIKMIQSGVQTLSKPIMKYYVPRIKLGMAAHMMEAKMDFMLKQRISDPDIIHSELGKIWDSVDNRAGQMVYDNLFWNKTAKDLSFLTIRAVGWDFGSAREYGGAAKDIGAQISKLFKGQRPELTDRMAFTIATPLVIGTLGAVTTYFATGKPPQTMEDYFYPPSGRIGTNGKPERMSYPSYMKDAFAFFHSPAQTAINKLHPMFEQATELYQNKDFYGTEIYGPGDLLYKKGLDVLGWYGKSFAPFSAKMGTQRHDAGIPALEAYGESFAGLQHAPRYITSSKAEDLAFELAKRQWQAGSLTKDQVDRRELMNKFQIQQRMGTLKMSDVNKAEQSGSVRPSDIDKLYDDQELTKFQSEFKSLHLKEALDVMRVASKEERVQLQELLEDKLDQELDNYPPELQGDFLKRYEDYTK